jgi:phosphate starvation-inducible PhoH-like protein
MNIKKLTCIMLINQIISKKLISNLSKPNYFPKSNNQLEYKIALNNKLIDLLICTGPAGTGKTLLACQYAIENLQKNNINKIIITRPTISIEENLGFLPGNIKDKMHPWTVPIFDIFKEYYSQKEIDQLINNNYIEIVPIGFMQGRTFKDSIIIADEMQNSTPNQMFMLLTRLGIKSKMIITGDLMQTQIKNNGLYDLLYKINLNYELKDEMKEDGINIINLQAFDIQRSKIVSKIISIYKK